MGPVWAPRRGTAFGGGRDRRAEGGRPHAAVGDRFAGNRDPPLEGGDAAGAGGGRRRRREPLAQPEVQVPPPSGPAPPVAPSPWACGRDASGGCGPETHPFTAGERSGPLPGAARAAARRALTGPWSSCCTCHGPPPGGSSACAAEMPAGWPLRAAVSAPPESPPLPPLSRVGSTAGGV